MTEIGSATAHPRAWRPLLDGRSAEQARSAVDAIAETLDRSMPPVQGNPLPHQIGLASGRAGPALFYACLAQDDARWAATAAACLNEAIDAASRIEVGPSLAEGVAGIAWVASHLARLGIVASDQVGPFCRSSIERIADELARTADAATPDNVELLYGLAGLGICALERLPDPTARALLAAIVERLRAQAQIRPEGLTWWTAPEHTGAPEQYPHGYYNLGLAHGVPGVIGLLGLVCAGGIARDLARPLLDGAVAWLLDQRRPFDVGDRFPIFVGEGIEPTPGRLTWCYGDPGIATALLVAARAVEHPAWELTALELALAAAERPPEVAGVFDAPLCHGAIGVGHILNRLWQATGEPRRAEAARSWMARGLAMRRPGGKLGGFHALVPGQDGRLTRRVAFRGLLDGLAGIGLALLAATTDVEPAWDRVLLLS